MVAPDEEAIVRCETSQGPVTMKLERELSPNGYDRAVELFERHFFDDSHFYRVVPKFLVQFGISYSTDKELQKFAHSQIADDPPKGIKFKKGTISYAGNGDNSRTSQLFISYGAAASLGREKWETPLGEVIEGMEHVENLYSYGDMPPWGEGPVQGKIHGNPDYIYKEFPKTDRFIHCKVERLNTDEGVPVGGVPVDERELLQVDSPYHPHVRDQIGLPSVGDPITTYGGFMVLAMMGIAMLVLKSRKKEVSKSN